MRSFLPALAYLLALGSSLPADQFPTTDKARFYDEHCAQQRQAAYEALNHLQFEGTETVLDIGCGGGKVTANIAGRLPQGKVRGMDISRGMIEYAQQEYAPFYNNLSFYLGDIEDPQSLSEVEVYDTILSFNTFHWVKDQLPCIKRIHQALKPGGCVLMSIPCAYAPEMSAVYTDVTHSDRWKLYFSEYQHPRKKLTAAEYEQLLRDAGFRAYEVVEKTYTYYFETKKDFMDWYRSFTPMLLKLPPNEHTLFLSDLAERYIATYPLDSQGRLVMVKKELLLKAYK